MSRLRALAPAKVNLGLFVGARRERDGRHELASVMQSISLADELTLADAGPAAVADEVLCPGVPGSPQENLAARALAAFRLATGWAAPPQRLEIVKRIPLAAGLAGGSADAAATLRLARAASGLGDPGQLHDIARDLGADVPAALAPGRWLATGAGELLRPLPPPRAAFGVLVLPLQAGLSTADVYAAADRLGPGRDAGSLRALAGELLDALAAGAPLPEDRALLHNDLQRAALSLRPEIEEALEQALAAGAQVALVSGSGPTVVGLFAPAGAGAGGAELAQDAARRLGGRASGAMAAVPVDETYGAAAPG